MKLNLLKPVAIALLTAFAITSCVKDDDYDIPDPNGKKPLPDYSGQVVSFANVLTKVTASVATYTADEAIEGYVISSDEGGNFYKKIYIQNADKNQGLSVAIDKSGLYTEFPVGAKIQLRLKDLTTQLNNSAIEVGYGTYTAPKSGRVSVGTMAEAIYKKHLFDTGERKTVAELAKVSNSIQEVSTDAHVDQLITLKGVHFPTDAVGKTLYDKNNALGNATNYKLTDANGKTIIFRTSSYAKFKDEKVPAGEVEVTGVLTKFNKDYQFMISNYADLVVKGGTSTSTQTGTQTSTTVETLEASNATVADYVVGKTVKLHGTTVVKSGRTYIVFKDGTEIQVFSAKGVTISDAAKEKLATEGYEINVTGVFTDYALKNGTVVKEILYSKESDIEFIKAPAAITYVDVDATTATLASDYQVGKHVNLKNATLKVEGGKSYVVFSDGNKIQLYSPNLKSFSKDAQTKLGTDGQKLTSIKGKFEDYSVNGNTVHQLVYAVEGDIVFGDTPVVQLPELNAATATVADFNKYKDKKVKLEGTITVKGSSSFIVFTTDNTEIQLYATNTVFKALSKETKAKLKTAGTKLIVTGTLGEHTNKNNVTTKQIKYEKEADLDFQ
jgi:nucleic acid binding OB-fold tRNA/helicase-type